MNKGKTIYLKILDFEIICDVIKDQLSTFKDPPPIYDKSYWDKLESVAAIPEMTFDQKDLYPTVFDKAACYLYFVNKLHPFNNGNKRVSILSTYVFLKLNGYELNVDPNLLYDFAKKITVSKNDQRQELKNIANFLQKNSRFA